MTTCIESPVGQATLKIRKGSTFNPTLTVTDANGTPVNYTGYAGRLQIRASADATTTLKELTTANNGLVVGNGTVQIVISATDTAALTFSQGVYDLELVSPGGVVTCLLEGQVLVMPEVTR